MHATKTTSGRRTAPARRGPVDELADADKRGPVGLTGPVLADLAAGSTPGIAALDARWAAAVLAGQAITYAVHPGPADALADVLRMTGLAADPAPFGWTATRRATP